MTIDGVYYTEPELAAKFRQMQETIQRLDGENYNSLKSSKRSGRRSMNRYHLRGGTKRESKTL